LIQKVSGMGQMDFRQRLAVTTIRQEAFVCRSLLAGDSGGDGTISLVIPDF
jgi:hypothetical protein